MLACSLFHDLTTGVPRPHDRRSTTSRPAFHDLTGVSTTSPPAFDDLTTAMLGSAP